jgi:hypothetical protein
VKNTRLVLALSLALILLLGSVSWSGPSSPTTTSAPSSPASPMKQPAIPAAVVPARTDTRAPATTTDSGTAKALRECRETVQQLLDIAGRLETADCSSTGERLSLQFDEFYKRVQACSATDGQVIVNTRAAVLRMQQYAARCTCDKIIVQGQDAQTVAQNVIKSKCWNESDNTTFQAQKVKYSQAQDQWNLRCSAAANVNQKALWNSVFSNMSTLLPLAQTRCTEATTCKSVANEYVKEVAFIKEHNTPHCKQGDYQKYLRLAREQETMYYKACTALLNESKPTFSPAYADLTNLANFCATKDEVLNWRCPWIGTLIMEKEMSGPTFHVDKKISFVWHGCNSNEDAVICEDKYGVGAATWRTKTSNYAPFSYDADKEVSMNVCCAPPGCYQQYLDAKKSMEDNAHDFHVGSTGVGK